MDKTHISPKPFVTQDPKAIKHIRAMEMDHDGAMDLDMKVIRKTQAVLDELIAHPTYVRVVQRSNDGKESFRLEIRDPALASGTHEERQARADFYLEGLNPMVTFVLSHYGHEFPPDMDIRLSYHQEKGVIDLTTNYACNSNDLVSGFCHHITTLEPVHIIAKHLADNGVNFPGSSNFQQLGKD